MTKPEHSDAHAIFSVTERDYIRREFGVFFSTLPTVAEGFILAQSPHRLKNGQLTERMTNMSQNSFAMNSSRATA